MGWKIRVVVDLNRNCSSKYNLVTDHVTIYIFVMCLRKPWLRVKSVNFDFSAKSSSTDYNGLNKPTPKSLAHIKSKKSLAECGVPKNERLRFFPFFAPLKSLLFTLSHG